MEKFSRGIVFGVFDGLHPGHQYFLTEAAKQCDELVVVATLDDVVLHFKNRLPKSNLASRMAAVKSFGENLKQKITVVPGDGANEMGQWRVLQTHKPDLVFIGYDQAIIEQEMRRLGVKTAAIKSFLPDQYKSSLLNS